MKFGVWALNTYKIWMNEKKFQKMFFGPKLKGGPLRPPPGLRSLILTRGLEG